MRHSLAIILTLSFVNTFSQSTTKTIVVRDITWIYEKLYSNEYDTFVFNNETLDLNFLKDRFNLLYLLPDTLTFKQHKNRTLKVWALNTEKNFSSNWFNTYTYDQSGRLNYFSYSGCVPCSQFPFEYNIAYKPTGEIDRIFDKKYGKKSYRFTYRKDGQIRTIEIYEYGKLHKVITRLT